MPTLNDKLNGIVANTKQLIQLCEVLKAENTVLKAELSQLNLDYQRNLSDNKTLNEKLKALAVARTFESTEKSDDLINEKKLDTKRKINDFVQEIEKCIELLR